MVNSFRASLWLGIPIVAAIAALMPAEGVVAQGKKSTAPLTLSDMQLADSIQTLRSARLTLEMADHDYGGHRADAVRDITAAVRQLRQALEAVHKGKAIPKGEKKKEKGGKEPQAVSDAQLTAAIPVLEQTASLLKMASNDYGGHRGQAVTDLEAAVRQLKTALKYSKEKNQEKP
jgi:uncharacterized protein YoxC